MRVRKGRALYALLLAAIITCLAPVRDAHAIVVSEGAHHPEPITRIGPGILLDPVAHLRRYWRAARPPAMQILVEHRNHHGGDADQNDEAVRTGHDGSRFR